MPWSLSLPLDIAVTLHKSKAADDSRAIQRQILAQGKADKKYSYQVPQPLHYDSTFNATNPTQS